MDWLAVLYLFLTTALYTTSGIQLIRMRGSSVAYRMEEQYERVIMRRIFPNWLVLSNWVFLVAALGIYSYLKYLKKDPHYEGAVPFAICMLLVPRAIALIRMRRILGFARILEYRCCPTCDYQLAPSNKHQRCPECDTPIDGSIIRQSWKRIENASFGLLT